MSAAPQPAVPAGPPQPPPVPNLDPKEKAKMDYQAQVDRQKLSPFRGAKWWELVWDKVFFAFVVGLVVFFGNMWLEGRRAAEARSLEGYKLAEARQRFVSEKRLDALLQVQTALNGVNGVFFTYTKDKKDAPTGEAGHAYDKALSAADDAISRSEFLFPVAFRTDAERYYQIHRHLSKLGVTAAARYREYLAALSREFDDACAAVFAGTDDPPRMTMADVGFEERDRMTPQQYLDRHFTHWQQHKSK